MEMSKEKEMEFILQLLAPQLVEVDWSKYTNKVDRFQVERELINRSRRIVEFTWRQITKPQEQSNDHDVHVEKGDSNSEAMPVGLLGIFKK